jgi:hypothetical protein
MRRGRASMSEEPIEIELIVAEVEPAAPGPEAVRREVTAKCRAIAEAVDDLADVTDIVDSREAAYALDLRDAKTVRLYAVTDGWLHVFAGPSDPPVPVQSREAINPRFPSSCEYAATPITSDARFEYAFHGNAGPLNSPDRDGAFSDVVRVWTFHVGQEKVRIEVPASDALSPLHSEHTRFAHRLARLILRAEPGGDRGSPFG